MPKTEKMTLDQLIAEVETVKARCREYNDDRWKLINENADLRRRLSEIVERGAFDSLKLRYARRLNEAEVREARLVAQRDEGTANALREIDERETEIARLREALEKIARATLTEDARLTARAVLAQKG